MRNERARAIEGYTLIELLIICSLIAGLAAIAIPRVLEGRKASHEGSAIATLRSLYTAQLTYFEKDRDGDGQQEFASNLFQLEGILSPELTTAVSVDRKGYHFEILPSPSYAYGWSAVANPLIPGTSGDRYFFVDETGVIRYSPGGPADPDSSAVGK